GLQSGNYVRLTIRDNGEGMDEEVQRYLFEPFFTTKAARHGIGLGLSTVYGIVRQHQGFIEVESVKDVGTSLYVFFPSVAQPIDSSDNAASETPSLPDAPVQSPKIILIVDDEEPILALMAMILEEAGYIVLQANRGSVALNLAQQGQTPDLLLSDVAMPEMNGHELYRALLPRLPDLKVLFVSGYTEMHALPDGKESARMAFLGKPFTWQQLLQKVEEMVNN
ncbi:MAG: response regulator, partial [Caldilineaceae bacterium]|nr:response regulator [Caldilineaceae bacterium]